MGEISSPASHLNRLLVFLRGFLPIPEVTTGALLGAVISLLKPYVSKTDQTPAVAVHTFGRTVYTVSDDSSSSAEAAWLLRLHFPGF